MGDKVLSSFLSKVMRKYLGESSAITNTVHIQCSVLLDFVLLLEYVSLLFNVNLKSIQEDL